jgi:hypothetical protein
VVTKKEPERKREREKDQIIEIVEKMCVSLLPTCLWFDFVKHSYYIERKEKYVSRLKCKTNKVVSNNIFW